MLQDGNWTTAFRKRSHSGLDFDCLVRERLVSLLQPPVARNALQSPLLTHLGLPEYQCAIDDSLQGIYMNNTQVCEALFDAFSEGDEKRIRALCAPDMQARQNNNPPMDLESLIEFSRSVLRVVDNFRYEDVRRSETATGFVEEHSIRGSLPDSSELDLAVCVVADVRDGKVRDLREYLDVSVAAGLVAALS